MKPGVTKQQLITSLEATLKLTREGVESLELRNDDTVVIHFDGGYNRVVSIHMDSGIAIIRDVSKAID